MKKNLDLDNWVGVLITLAFFIVAITPNSFHIPIVAQPWIFIGSMAWVITFTSGVFSS